MVAIIIRNNNNRFASDKRKWRTKQKIETGRANTENKGQKKMTMELSYIR